MRVLVTGGAGFIGSHVVEACLTAGHEVAVVDDLSSGKKENLPGGVPLYQVDIADAEAVGRVFGSCGRRRWCTRRRRFRLAGRCGSRASMPR